MNPNTMPVHEISAQVVAGQHGGYGYAHDNKLKYTGLNKFRVIKKANTCDHTKNH